MYFPIVNLHFNDFNESLNLLLQKKGTDIKCTKVGIFLRPHFGKETQFSNTCYA